MKPSAARALVALAFLASLGAADAHAQLGGLGKKLKRAAGVEAGVTERTVPPPKFDDRTIEMTDAHVAAYVGDMKEENDLIAVARTKHLAERKAYDDAMKTYPKQEKDWQAADAKWEQCANAIMGAEDRKNAGMQDKMIRSTGATSEADMQQRMEAVATRMKAAQAKGDQAEMMRLMDSVQKSMQPANQMGMDAAASSTKATADVSKKCGQRPPEPPRPSSPTWTQPRVENSRVARLGMKGEQWPVMLDRLEPLCLNDQKDFDRAIRNGYSEGEQQALATHGATLRTECQRKGELLSGLY